MRRNGHNGQATDGGAWEYAPAPEARDIVKIQPRYGLFIDGAFVEPHSGRSFATVNPATEETLAEVAYADAEDIDRAVRAARRAYETVWGKLPGKERAKYLFRIARILQERSREFAVLESLDGGKPIRGRAMWTSACSGALFLSRGLGRQAGVRLSGAHAAPAGRRGTDYPLELPAADGGMEDCARARLRQYGGVEARRDDPAHRAAAVRGVPAGRPAARRGEHRLGDGRTGAWLVQHPDIDKIAFTGSTEVGRLIQKAVAGTRKRLTLELGGKAANVISKTPRLTRQSRAS